MVHFFTRSGTPLQASSSFLLHYKLYSYFAMTPFSLYIPFHLVDGLQRPKCDNRESKDLSAPPRQRRWQITCAAVISFVPMGWH
jgi:hypothetical protein